MNIPNQNNKKIDTTIGRAALWPLFFILFTISVTAYPFFESFNYTATYASHNYTSGGGDIANPVYNPITGKYAFGENQTTSDLVAGTHTTMYRNITTNGLFSSGTYVVEYLLYNNRTEYALVSGYSFNIYARYYKATESPTNQYIFSIKHGDYPNMTRFITELPGGENCSVYDPIIVGDNTMHRYKWVIESSANKYTGWKDGIPICGYVDLGSENSSITSPKYDQQLGFVWTRLNTDDDAEGYINDFMFNESSDTGLAVTAEPCGLSTLCDNFEYIDPIVNHGWLFLSGGFGVDTTKTPTNGSVCFTGDVQNTLTGLLPLWDVNYRTSANTVVTKSSRVPQISVEFTLKQYDLQDPEDILECAKFTSYGTSGYQSASLYFCPNGSIWRRTDPLIPASVALVVSGIPVNTSNSVKLLYYFPPGIKPLWNSSLAAGYINIYVNEFFQDEVAFLDIRSQDITKVAITKNIAYDFCVGSLYVYPGGDKNIDTLHFEYTNLYTDPSEGISISTDSGDIAEAITSLYPTFGLKSKTSRYLIGALIILLSLVGLLFLAIMGHFPIPGILYIVIAIIEACILTFFGLFPAWILIIFFIIAIITGLLTLFAKPSGG